MLITLAISAGCPRGGRRPSLTEAEPDGGRARRRPSQTEAEPVEAEPVEAEPVEAEPVEAEGKVMPRGTLYSPPTTVVAHELRNAVRIKEPKKVKA